MNHAGGFALFEQWCMLLRFLLVIGSDDSLLLSNEMAIYQKLNSSFYPCDLPASRIELVRLDRPHPHGRSYLSISAR